MTFALDNRVFAGVCDRCGCLQLMSAVLRLCTVHVWVVRACVHACSHVVWFLACPVSL